MYQASFVSLFLLAAVGLTGCGAVPRQTIPYLDAKKNFTTTLTRKAPAPEQWIKDQKDPEGSERIRFASGTFDLRAWVGKPHVGESKLPAIVFLHDSFVFAVEDWALVQPFLEVGFFVMCPTYRGENGNRGDFEMFWGEVDDAKAAVNHLAHNVPFIDPDRIYVFGHGTGGNIAALLTLQERMPAQITASSSGLYPFSAFTHWQKIIPFDLRNAEERRLRILLGNTASMKRPHIAYLGKDDNVEPLVAEAEAEIAQTAAPLRVVTVAGDRQSSLARAQQEFLKAIREHESAKAKK